MTIYQGESTVDGYQLPDDWPLMRMADATMRYEVKLAFVSRVYGGLNPDSVEAAKRPWKDRIDEMIAIARAEREKSVPLLVPVVADSKVPPYTIFRRSPQTGEISLGANQIRTLLQEVARTIYAGVTELYGLQRALRSNLVIVPGYVPFLRDGHGLLTPDHMDEMARPIKGPPFDRSIVMNPEFVEPPLTVEFALYVCNVGAGANLMPDVVQYLFNHGGAWIGLSSHRGIQGTDSELEAGRFVVESFTATSLTGTKPPKLPGVVKTARAKKPEAADDVDSP